tara:strand:- start:157 stop:1095 length:939 start_codon:yes stop_codon:yes gene_type:complete
MNNLKFAISTDNSSEPSYYCKNSRYYRFVGNEDVTSTDLPYSAFWTYPELFDGHFINLNNSVYPVEDFDIIFAAIECDVKHLAVLRALYPNAVIVGMYKEYWNNNPSIRNYIIENTDAYIHPYATLDVYRFLHSTTPKNSYIIEHPINHKLIQKKYNVEKSNIIFNYQKKVDNRKSTTNDVIIKKLLDNKVDLQIANYTGGRGLQPFIDGWKESRYMLSTDMFPMGGIQSVQCAVLNTIMVGGNNDNHKILFPKLVGNDVDFLISKINQLESDLEYRKKIQSYAYDKCISIFSYDAIREKIIGLYKDITNGR